MYKISKTNKISIKGVIIILFSKFYKEKLLNKIINYTICNYTKLDTKNFKLGEIPYNFRCHLNSVQKVKENKADEVYLCMTLNEDYKDPIIHFINKKDNTYMDNTWGWLYEENNYYIIRKINENEYNNIGNILEITRQSLLDLYSKKWVRNLLLKNDLII